MELIFPTIEYKKAMFEYRREHIDNGETSIHGSAGFIRAENYENWLEKIKKAVTAAEPGFATGEVYLAVVENKIVGTIAIRHTLNETLLNTGGHIGYGVRPSERRKGYAAKMLSLALEKCRKLGIEKVLVTCDKNNIGSAKTIIKNGGVMENEFVEENGNITQRYWINLKNNS